ncbi:MAG: hypothetical protein R3C44_05930 [Chloroflexota bacterium]
MLVSLLTVDQEDVTEGDHVTRPQDLLFGILTVNDCPTVAAGVEQDKVTVSPTDLGVMSANRGRVQYDVVIRTTWNSRDGLVKRHTAAAPER